MTYQGNLFSPFRDSKAGQAELFSCEEGTETTDRCEVCNRFLIVTVNGFRTCPMGCGRLHDGTAQDVDSCGQWFEEGGAN